MVDLEVRVQYIVRDGMHMGTSQLRLCVSELESVLTRLYCSVVWECIYIVSIDCSSLTFQKYFHIRTSYFVNRSRVLKNNRERLDRRSS